MAWIMWYCRYHIRTECTAVSFVVRVAFALGPHLHLSILGSLSTYAGIEVFHSTLQGGYAGIGPCSFTPLHPSFSQDHTPQRLEISSIFDVQTPNFESQTPNYGIEASQSLIILMMLAVDSAHIRNRN